MPALSSYANTENTAVVLLNKMGYQVWEDESGELYMAERDGWDFAAKGLTELLGVVSIFERISPEEYSEYWWRIREPWLRDDLPKAPKPYKAVWEKS